jgi:hypothetical protein
MCVYVCMYVRVCVCMSVRVCVCMYVRVRVHVCACLWLYTHIEDVGDNFTFFFICLCFGTCGLDIVENTGDDFFYAAARLGRLGFRV